MHETRAELQQAIRDANARFRLRIDREAEEKLAAYALELARWNQRINLMRFRGWKELVERHYEDGLATLRHIPEGSSSLVDVGAGGGIPGVIIAVLRPEIEVVALEPIHKKHAFLRTLRRRLRLDNYCPRAERLEERNGPGELCGRFDVAVSRATFALSEWLDRGRLLVRSGGCVLGMEGREEAELPPGAARFPYAAPGRERAIVVYWPEATT